jgi:hypothetical protein
MTGRPVKRTGPKRKRPAPAAGADAQALSLAPAPVIEQSAQEAGVSEESKEPVVVEGDEAATLKEPDEGGSVILKNGSEINADTVMHCGKCGARFYAKDAPEGSCPATDAAGNVCGGTLGPIEA